jgi:MFS family permease
LWAFGPSFRRLLAVRLTSQLGDGVFEVALASLFFFSPERATTPGGIAAAFAVLTLPFTVIGPWAGVPLDRWSRRNTLMIGNLVRAALAVVVALLLALAAPDPVLYAVVLTFLSINRFLLAALSAGLPHVVDRAHLVAANAVTPTLGTAAYLVGGGIAYTARLTGAGHPALVLIVGALLAGAAALALRLRPAQLGPDREPATPGTADGTAAGIAEVGRDLVRGLRHLRSRHTASSALGAMTGHRLLFGVSTLATILLARNYFGDGSSQRGLTVLGWVLGAGAAGFLVAAFVTPWWVRRRHDPTTVVALALTGAGLATAALVPIMALPVLLAAAAVIGWAGQSLKICVDTLVQRDVDDAFRGRVFSVYDVLFNAAFVVAIAVAAVVIPSDGDAPVVFAVLAVAYLALSWAYRRATVRQRS